MREFLYWLAGAMLAFGLAAGAFLLLADLLAGPPDASLAPETRPAGVPQGGLDLRLDEEGLAGLESARDQPVELAVANEGDEPLREVNLTLVASSEDTSLASARYYRAKVEDLEPGRSAPVVFTADLSSPTPEATDAAGAPQEARTILEVRATTPGGASAVRTAILPP